VLNIDIMTLKTKENYLKTMYLLTDEEGNVSMSELGKRIGVSSPTVNSMVKRLRDKGWVVYEKYKPLKLTCEGEKTAALILRKHRIAEVFLFEKMSFSWEEVHDIAEDMEHIGSEAFFDRMDEILGYPDSDPHGSPIPNKEGIMDLKSYFKLSDFNRGDVVRLCSLVNSTNEFLLFLNNKEIGLGTEIVIEFVEPFDRSMTLSYKGHKSVVISKGVCDRLLVEKVM
jgi:DtxR family Mn-dependent transcriptional regulator